ncbi:hypothetical protein HFP72_26795 [Nocardiopsis sp. ARC36]
MSSAALLLGERVTPLSLVAAVLLVGGVALASLGRRGAGRGAPPVPGAAAPPAPALGAEGDPDGPRPVPGPGA